mgnify:FL=1
MAWSVIAHPLVIDDDCIVNPVEVRQMETVVLKQLADGWTEPEHYFCDGVYVRKAALRAGRAFVSKIHRYEGISILVSGVMSTWMTDDGYRITEAPFIGVRKPLTRLVGYPHCDSVIVCVHASKCQNVADVEKEIYYVAR